MREFASNGNRAARLPKPAKLVYTGFCLLTLAGVVGSAVLYHEMVGLADLDRISAYYSGQEVEGDSEGASDGVGASESDGPVLDFEDEGDGPVLELEDPLDPGPATPSEPIVVAQSYRKLLEVSHFHLFSMPVLLLIVGHLFMLTAWSPRAKMVWIGAGTGGTALHVLAPWAVHWWGGAAAWVYPVSGVLLLGSFTVMLLVPVWDMWRPRAATKT